MKKFLLRGIMGTAVIFLVNLILRENGVALEVGVNPVSFLTSGSLGFPGVALLYGVLALHFL